MLFLGFLVGLRAQDESYLLNSRNFKSPPTSLSMAPDGKVLLCGLADGTIHLLDPQSLESSLEIEEAHRKAITALAMTPDMERLISAGGSVIKIWARDGSLLANLNAHATTIWKAQLSKDGNYLLSTAFNKTFLLWDVKHAQLEAKMQGHEDICLAACISPDMQLMASGSQDQSIRLWDLESREQVDQMYGPLKQVYDLEFSPDTRWLAAASQEHDIRVYQVEGRKLTYVLEGHRKPVRRLDFFPGGRYMLSASEDQSVILWDLKKGDRVHQFYEGEGEVLDVASHPDGRSFYSVSTDGGLKHYAMDPEIFVLAYYAEAYLTELEDRPELEERRKGESKKDHALRQQKAMKIKQEIAAQFYQRYLREH